MALVDLARFDAAVFDLDGTLIDSAPDIHASVNAVLRLNGARLLTLDQVRGFVGGGVDLLWRRVIAATGLPIEAQRDLVALQQDEIDRLVQDITVLQDELDRLREQPPSSPEYALSLIHL